jgi:hypothetical protein
MQAPRVEDNFLKESIQEVLRQIEKKERVATYHLVLDIQSQSVDGTLRGTCTGRLCDPLTGDPYDGVAIRDKKFVLRPVK